MVIKKLFSADLRSLALLRIGVAFIIIIDLINRSSDLVAHYTDHGAYPISAFSDYQKHNAWNLSFHTISGDWQIQLFLFLLAGLFALLLLVGYKTTIMTIVCWLFLLSLQARNPFIQNAGDTTLRLLLFWGIFLPWGKKISIDHLLSPILQKSNTVTSLGILGYFLQIAIIYLFAAWYKFNSPTWIGGNAVQYSLQLESMATYVAHFLRVYPDFLRISNYSVLLFEAIGPILLFVPLFNGMVKILVVLGFIFMHISFGLNLDIGVFPLVSMVSVLGFLPPSFWNKVSNVKIKNYWKLFRIINYLKNLEVSMQLNRKKIIHFPILIIIIRPLFNLSHHLLSIFICVIIFWIIWWNISELAFSDYKMPKNVADFGFYLRLNQKWNMFSNFQHKDTGWYVIPGLLSNGKIVDIYKAGGDFNFLEPKLISSTYKNEHWRKYLRSLRKKDFQIYYASYLCREWNNTHIKDQKLINLEMILIFRKQPSNDEIIFSKKQIFKHSCA